MPRSARLTTVGVVLALAAAACAESTGVTAEAPDPRAVDLDVTAVEFTDRVTDATGAEIVFDTAPERIVCLTGICDDALVELGMEPAATTGHELLGRDDYLGEGAAAIPAVGGGFGSEDPAEIAAYEPDLVIGLAGVHDQLRAPLEPFAPLWLVGVDTWEESVGFLRDVAAVTDRADQQVAAEIAFRTAVAEAQIEAGESGLADTTVLSMWRGSGIGVDTAESLLGDFLSQFFTYPWPALSEDFDTASAYSLEAILAAEPQVVFIQSFSFGDNSAPLSEELADDPVWQLIPAVADGRAFEVSPALWASGRGTRALGIILDEAMTLAGR